MTWIRWEVDSAFSDVVDDLAQDMGLPPAHVYGLYVATCNGFGRHRKDGRVDLVKDSALEAWARWKGKAGRWAAAFRQRCTGEGGTLRGWWRNEGPLAKQERDANKRKPSKNPHGFVEGTPEKPARYVTTTATTTPSGSTERNETTEAVVEGLAAAAQAITASLNRGLQDNPAIGSAFNPVTASAGSQVVADWVREGIPVEFAASEVYRIAKGFPASGDDKQIGSLRYCAAAVRKAWSRHQSKRVHNGQPAPSHGPASTAKPSRLRTITE